jgi:predicted Zn finger-like uncharacterized protein
MGTTYRHKKMRAITHCPVCLTQFFVSEEQLNQHRGQVRCGHCLNVFDANVQSIPPVDPAPNAALDVNESDDASTEMDHSPIATTAQVFNVVESELSAYLPQNSAGESVQELSLAAKIASDDAPDPTAVEDHAVVPDEKIQIEQQGAEIEAPAIEPTISFAQSLPEDDIKVLVTDEQADAFDYLAELEPIKSTKKLSSVLTTVSVIVLVLLAMTQSLYFLRNPIAIYYPNFQSYLQQVCQKIGCSIDLPKKIELIIIDDSDMQEDADHAGLIILSTTLVNQAKFNQAYPNIELTLTDVEDRPALRRLFKPIEYLPAGTKIETGITSAEAVKVKLAISVTGMSVSGYRVFLTY